MAWRGVACLLSALVIPCGEQQPSGNNAGPVAVPQPQPHTISRKNGEKFFTSVTRGLRRRLGLVRQPPYRHCGKSAFYNVHGLRRAGAMLEPHAGAGWSPQLRLYRVVGLGRGGAGGGA